MSPLSPTDVFAPVTALAKGQALGGWVLDERVAEGPFSEVWRAHGSKHGRAGAIKIARTGVGARMLREEQAIATRLRYNTNRVVRVVEHHDAEADGSTSQVSYLVMPWIDRTFRDVLRDVKTEDDRAHALALFGRVCEAVGEVHLLGVVHGDLKPENILIDGDALNPTPLVADFGLAKQLREHRLGRSLRQSLHTGDVLTGGTLAYMPPEAVKGAEPTYQGDVYALGVILHETLLGRRPDKATSADTLRGTLPEEAVAILLRALAYEPAQRYGRAAHLESDLRTKTADLLLTGASRRALAARRFVRSGFAAFFVALRYASVVGLLGLYAFMLGGAVLLAVNDGIGPGLAVLIPASLFFMLHVMIRWEGPETQAELAARTGFFHKG